MLSQGVGRPELQRRRQEPRLSPHSHPDSRPRPPISMWTRGSHTDPESRTQHTAVGGRAGLRLGSSHSAWGRPAPPGGPRLAWKTMCSVGAPGPRRPLAHLEDHVLSEGMLRTADDVLCLRLSEGHGLR